MEDNSIKLFESKQIRTAWDEEQEKWYIMKPGQIVTLGNRPQQMVKFPLNAKRFFKGQKPTLPFEEDENKDE